MRPASAPSARQGRRWSDGGAAFLHRDLFAKHAAPAADSLRSPKHRKADSGVLPSRSKLERWDNKLGKYPLLGWLESRTGIRKVYLALFALLCGSLLVFRGVGLGLLVGAVGFLYPLHMSLKTIENCTALFEEISGQRRHLHTELEIKEKRAEIIGELRQWLVYWVVYGLFNTFESLSDFSLSWLPVYHPLKLLFLLWAFLPQWQGSQLVFDIVVRPVLQRHEGAIESGVETAQQAARQTVGHVGRVVRAKSIQLAQAVQKTGEHLLSSQVGSSSSSSSSSTSDVLLSLSDSSNVRARVAAIETMSNMGVSSTAAAALPTIGEREPERAEGASAEDNSRQPGLEEAFEAASRVAEEMQRQ